MPGQQHIKGAPSDVNRYYEKCIESPSGKEKGKSYCAAVAWSIFCKNKDPNHPSCSKGEWAESPKDLTVFERTVNRLRARAKLDEQYPPIPYRNYEDVVFYRSMVHAALQVAGLQSVEVPEDALSGGKLVLVVLKASLVDVLPIVDGVGAKGEGDSYSLAGGKVRMEYEATVGNTVTLNFRQGY